MVTPDTTRRTKIVATIGPASAAIIPELVEAGVDAVRLNFSHGTQAEHAEIATLLADAGVDMLLLESMNTIGEMRIALSAARSTGSRHSPTIQTRTPSICARSPGSRRSIR